MMQRFLALLAAIGLGYSPSMAGPSSIAVYSGEETFNVYFGVYKPMIWAYRETDIDDDDDNPFENSGEYRFDLKEIVQTDAFPVGIFASVNFFGILEPRVSLEWFSFEYDDSEVGFQGTVDRTDFALDVLLGYDLNRRGEKLALGLVYQFYPYLFAGVGRTDYEESLTSAGESRNGNVVLADVGHLNLGFGARFGLAKLFNVGAEIGIKAREFKTVESPQPSGKAGEGYLRVNFALAYGR